MDAFAGVCPVSDLIDVIANGGQLAEELCVFIGRTRAKLNTSE